MNIDTLKSSGVDYDEGVRRFMGRAHLYEKVLAKFPRDKTFPRIQADYESKDNESLLRDAHEFKGMCGNIGLLSLFSASDALVKLLRSGEFPAEELDAAYAALEREYTTVRNAVLAAMEE